MARLHPIVKVNERTPPKPFGDQLTLDTEATFWPCPSCGATGLHPAPLSIHPCRTCRGSGAVPYNPADTSEVPF